ncbi:MAG: hypothetical protein ACO3JL_13700, partial [Myxococcota bacterium]
TAKNQLESLKQERERGVRYELLPFHAMPPDLQERGISTLQDGRLVVYLRTLKNGKVDDEDPVWLEQEHGKWRVSSW